MLPVFYRKSTAPYSSDFCRLADLDYDSWSLRKSVTFKTSNRKYVFLKTKMCLYDHYFQAVQTALFYKKCVLTCDLRILKKWLV